MSGVKGLRLKLFLQFCFMPLDFRSLLHLVTYPYKFLQYIAKADTMEGRIQSELSALERANDVNILIAVESGSRAWGFPSADSDYDVRFIYIHRPEWYLSIDLEDRRDVIELPINERLDISGWDVRKALRLFHKSNPPLLEWLQCSIVYREKFTFAAKLRSLLPDFYSPKASFYHYLHMARSNMREYLQGETVRQKKYFYVLRPLLAMLWIEKDIGPVPIEFERLLDTVVTDSDLRCAIDLLLEAKRNGAELDQGPKIPAISHFIEKEINRLDSQFSHNVHPVLSVNALNGLFHSTLIEVWGKSIS
jgi:uncharacterized protein